MTKCIMGVLLVGGLILLGWMVRQVGITDLIASCQIVGFWIVPYLLLEIIPDCLHTAAWTACFQRMPRRPSIWQLYVIRLAGSAINQVTPTAALGGEVVKVWLLGPLLPRAQAMAAVVIDKASIALAQTCYLACGLLYAMGHFPLPGELQLALSLTISMVLLGLLGFIVSQRYGLLSQLVYHLSRLPFAQARLQQLSQRLAPLDAQLIAYYTAYPWRFGGSFLLHFVGFIVTGFKTYVLLRLLLGTQAPGWSEAMTMAVVVAALDQMCFLVPARLGTLEGTRVLVLSTVGITPAVGLAFGLMARLDSLLWNGIGLLTYALCTRQTFLARSIRSGASDLSPPPLAGNHSDSPAWLDSHGGRHPCSGDRDGTEAYHP
jgi:glycosyltransferase 2 family protein